MKVKNIITIKTECDHEMNEKKIHSILNGSFLLWKVKRRWSGAFWCWSLSFISIPFSIRILAAVPFPYRMTQTIELMNLDEKENFMIFHSLLWSASCNGYFVNFFDVVWCAAEIKLILNVKNVQNILKCPKIS